MEFSLDLYLVFSKFMVLHASTFESSTRHNLGVPVFWQRALINFMKLASFEMTLVEHGKYTFLSKISEGPKRDTRRI